MAQMTANKDSGSGPGSPETCKLSEESFFLEGRIPSSVVPNFQHLLSLRPVDLGTVTMFGRQIRTPRYVANYMRPYYFTGEIHAATPLPEVLKPLLLWANEMISLGIFPAPSGKAFNQALVNFYLDGDQYIGKHSDDEKQIVSGGCIFSASFGQERTFRVKAKKGNLQIDRSLKDGSYIVMAGKMQQEFTHEIPKVLGRRGFEMKPRVNVTFRMFDGP